MISYIGGFAFTLFVGMVGSYIAEKLKIPACKMIGAMVAVAIFNVISEKAIVPTNAKIPTQIITGIFIGLRVRRKDIQMLKSIIKPAAISVFLMIFFCSELGYILYRTSNIDRVTALLGCSPGGIVDILMLGMDLKVDISTISVLHTIRLFMVLSIFPAAFQVIINKYSKISKDKKNNFKMNYNSIKSVSQTIYVRTDKSQRIKMSITVAIAVVFGTLGKLSNIPAGTLVFTMVSISIFSVITDKGYIPITVKSAAQLLAGTLIGSNVTMSAVIQMRILIMPVIVMIFSYFIINIIIAMILYNVWHFDLQTAFFACTPGGASDICLMAEEFGCDTFKISIMQTFRTLSVISFYTIYIKLLL